MKKNNPIKVLYAALCLLSPMVAAEPQFPAADFEPIIIIQDTDLITKHSQITRERAEANPSKPDAGYTDPSAQSATPPPAPIEQTEAAPVKAKSDSPPPPPASVEQTEAAPVETGSDKSLSKQEDSLMENLPIALVILALAGFVFWTSKRSSPKSREVPPVSIGNLPGKEGETGVARYLNALNASAKKAVAETGVAKYLRAVEESAKKGV